VGFRVQGLRFKVWVSGRRVRGVLNASRVASALIAGNPMPGTLDPRHVTLNPKP